MATRSSCPSPRAASCSQAPARCRKRSRAVRDSPRRSTSARRLRRCGCLTARPVSSLPRRRAGTVRLHMGRTLSAAYSIRLKTRTALRSFPGASAGRSRSCSVRRSVTPGAAKPRCGSWCSLVTRSCSISLTAGRSAPSHAHRSSPRCFLKTHSARRLTASPCVSRHVWRATSAGTSPRGYSPLEWRSAPGSGCFSI